MRLRALSSLLLIAFLCGCSASEAAPDPTPAAEAQEQLCGDVSATVQKHLDSADVDTVVVVGQCTSRPVCAGGCPVACTSVRTVARPTPSGTTCVVTRIDIA